MEKVIVVEGKADKKQMLGIINEEVEVICTNGTISSYHLEELLIPYESAELHVAVDADFEGERIRQSITELFPWVHHIYTDEMYIEIEKTPKRLLAVRLAAAHIDVRKEFLQ